MRPQSLNIVASPGASSNPSDFRATISRLWRLLVTRHSSTKRAAFRRHLQASRGAFDADLAPIRPVSPPRSFCVSTKSRAHASFAFSRIRIGQLNPLCPTQMRRTLIPGQLDFFNLVNGQGGTNKKPTHPAFALPTRIDGSVRVHIFFRLTGLYLRLALAFRNARS